MPTAVPAMLLGGLVTVFGAYRSQHAGQAAGVLVLFLGAMPPSGAQLARLIASLQAQPVPAATVGAAQQALYARLRNEVLPRASM